MPGRTTKTPDLLSDISKVFDQAQLSLANHQKNYVSLYKSQSEAALFTTNLVDGRVKLTGERAFQDAFFQMVARVLPLKKGIAPADRVIKFIAGYTKFVNDKAAEKSTKREDGDQAEDDEDTTASRFTDRLLRFLIEGCLAKDKNVRYRVVQLIAEMISNLGAIEEKRYNELRSKLRERIHDKESSIRMQAVIALAKLWGSEEASEVEEGETVGDILFDTLAHDSAADVRRAALINITLNPTTLIPILARTRDTDATNRKLVYSTILDPGYQENGARATTHPRALTIAQRELIVRNGLGDREQSVKGAAASLLGTWVELVSSKGIDEKTPAPENRPSVEENVVAFLELFDLTEGKCAEDALLSVFTTRTDIFDGLKFGDAFWNSLSPEKAFLARVFVEHCIAIKDDARLESALPVVTALAFKIQSSYNDLLDHIQADEEERFLRGAGADDENRSQKEDERINMELVISEMLKLAVNLDYADEIGRRKMFQLVRDMVSQDALPESLVARCLDVLRTLSVNERDLIRVVVEVVHDLRDPSDSDDDVPRQDGAETEYGGTPVTVKPARVFQKPVAERTPEESAKAQAIDLKCLMLCCGMLERVNGTFEENSTLEGILRELIVPATNSKEIALREKGLIGLGLCCLIARRMALKSFQVFLHQVASSPEALKTRALQIAFDILMVHQGEFLGKRDENAENILKFLLNVLSREKAPKVQALLCIGLAKLILSGMISDERALTSLLMMYLSPESTGNLELRQALSYFFPVYCYSSPVNQRCMQETFISTFEKMSQMHKDNDEEAEIISMAQVGAMFLDWTDPQKAVDVNDQKADDMIQFDMANEIVKALFKKEMEKDDKRVLCQLLGKLHIPDKVDDYKLRCLKVLMHNLSSRRPLRDTVANNAFTRFDAAISKKFEIQLQDFSIEEYRKLAELQELFEFLDDIIPDDDVDEVEDNVPKKGKASTRKRRSESMVSTSTDAASMSSRPSVAQSKAKRQRFSTSDDGSDVGDDRTGARHSPPPPSAPTRSLPKRSAAAKKPIIVIDLVDDSDIEEIPPPRKDVTQYRVKNEETRTSLELGLPAGSRRSEDPILPPADPEDEEDEDEIHDDLLAQD